MVAPRSAVRLAADDALSDGEWHHINEVINAASMHAPHAQSVKVRRRARDQLRPTHSLTLTLDEEVRIGSRAIARNAISMAIRSGAYERDGDLIRLRPEQ